MNKIRRKVSILLFYGSFYYEHNIKYFSDAMRERALNYKKMMEQKYKKNEPKENSPPPSPRTEVEETQEDEKMEDSPVDVTFRDTMTAKYDFSL